MSIIVKSRTFDQRTMRLLSEHEALVPGIVMAMIGSSSLIWSAEVALAVSSEREETA